VVLRDEAPVAARQARYCLRKAVYEPHAAASQLDEGAAALQA
jgi:hypothetical protein